MSTPPFTVVADYAYTSSEADDLQFEEGQVITVESVEDDEWYYGSYKDASGSTFTGIFPQNFVHAYTPPKHVTPGRRAPQPPVEANTASPTTQVVNAPPPPTQPIPVSAPIESVPKPVPASPAAPIAAAPPAAESATEPKPAKKKNAFADRIAAFNNSSEAPPTPFLAPKPSSFVRKPFVAAPSSYVPQLPPSNPPSSAHQPQSQPPPENIVHRDDPEEEEDGADKPIISLQDRIRLLRKQQEEEQARMEALANKKKHKSKPKQDNPEGASEEAGLEPVTSAGSVQTQHRQSIDAIHTGGSVKSADSNVGEEPPLPAIPQIPQHRASIDEELTSHDPQFQPKHESREPTTVDEEEQEEEEEEDDDDEEEEDEEEAKRVALRNRMAKISGGMGMVGMMGGFGFPGAMPPVSTKPKKTKKKAEEEEPEVHQAPIPIFPFADPNAVAGLNHGYPKPNTVEEQDEDSTDETEAQSEETAFHTAPAPPTTTRAVPPPPPTGSTRSVPPPPVPTQDSPLSSAPPVPPAPVHNDLGSVIDAYRSDSEDSGSDGDWGEDNNTKPVQRNTHAAPPPPAGAAPIVLPSSAGTDSNSVPEPRSVAPPPIPSVAPPGDAQSKTGLLPNINTSPLLAHTDEPSQPFLERSKSARSKRESFDLNAPKKPSAYDEVAEEALGDDEQTESEDNRRANPLPIITNRNSYIAGSGTIPPIPMSPLSPRNENHPDSSFSNAHSHPLPPPPPPPSSAATGAAPPPLPPFHEPMASSPTVGSHGSVPTELPPPPPPGGMAPGIPSASLIPQASRGYSSEDVAGYEADEDTDATRTPGALGDGSPVQLPATRAVPPPILGLGRSATVSHKASTGGAPRDRGHGHSQSYSQSPRAPPPPPPTTVPGNAQSQQPPVASPPIPQSGPAIGAETKSPRTSSSSQIRSPDTESGSRFSFKRASSDLTRSGSKRLSQSHTGPLPQKIDELPYTIDLSNETGAWWATKEGVPVSLLKRKDVRYEVDTQEVFKRNNRIVVIRDIYVLYPDYSQEVITVEYDAQTPSSDTAQVFTLKLNAPAAPNQADLEAAYNLYGKRLLDLVSKSSTHGLVPGAQNAPDNYASRVLKQVEGALPSVGSLGYGALVYVNKSNSYVRQYDEIKPGDIVTFKGAKLQGHKGSLHQKYSVEAGRGDTVNAGIIHEYDPAKRKIRVYLPDEGAALNKIKSESFRVNDLKSGEVKVFRVVGREYVGW